MPKQRGSGNSWNGIPHEWDADGGPTPMTKGIPRWTRFLVEVISAAETKKSEDDLVNNLERNLDGWERM